MNKHRSYVVIDTITIILISINGIMYIQYEIASTMYLAKDKTKLQEYLERVRLC